MSQPREITFRNIQEGQGKLFALDATASTNGESIASETSISLPFGTRNCHSCVGVFLLLPSRDCAYVAHINAWIKYRENEEDKYGRIASKLEGDQIKAQVLNRLQLLFQKNGWSKDDVDIPDISLICPGLDLGGSWNQSTGWYVVDAIQDFFDWPGGLRCDQMSHGFVFDPASQGTEMLADAEFRQEWIRTKTWEQKVHGEVRKYTAVDEEEGVDDWEVEVIRV